MKTYKIIMGYTPEELENKVNEEIKGDYYPLGGVSAIFSEISGIAFIQAVRLPESDVFNNDLLE